MESAEDFCRRLVEGPANLELPELDRLLIEYAWTLTRSPSSIERSHIEQLRTQGLDDRAIHDACCIVAYFAFVNRIADGLGVELES